MSDDKPQCSAIAKSTGKQCLRDAEPDCDGMCVQHWELATRGVTSQARRPELTPLVQGEILEELRHGSTLKAAAAAAGFDESTLRRWRRRGDSGEEPYRSFEAEVTRAMGAGETRLVRMIHREADNGDWRAAAWILAHRHPQVWGRQAQESRQDETLAVEIPEREMTTDELETAIAELIGA